VTVLLLLDYTTRITFVAKPGEHGACTSKAPPAARG